MPIRKTVIVTTILVFMIALSGCSTTGQGGELEVAITDKTTDLDGATPYKNSELSKVEVADRAISEGVDEHEDNSKNATWIYKELSQSQVQELISVSAEAKQMNPKNERYPAGKYYETDMYYISVTILDHTS